MCLRLIATSPGPGEDLMSPVVGPENRRNWLPLTQRTPAPWMNPEPGGKPASSPVPPQRTDKELIPVWNITTVSPDNDAVPTAWSVVPPGGPPLKLLHPRNWPMGGLAQGQEMTTPKPGRQANSIGTLQA